MTCARCQGLGRRLGLVTEDGPLDAFYCLNCGHVFGEPLLDHHYALRALPPPRPHAQQPVYDPVRRRLKFLIIRGVGSC